MATFTLAASSHTVVSTGWTNPSNAYATTGNDVYATAPLGTTKNASFTGDFGFADITSSSIPDGSAITAVRIVVEWGMTVAVTGSTLGCFGRINGVNIGSETTKTTAAEAQSTYTFTAGSVTLNDLRSASTLVKARIRYAKGNVSTDTTGNLDFCRLEVDYVAIDFYNTFDGGTDTTTITTGNSGGGSGFAWDAVTINSTNTLVYDASLRPAGQLAAKMTVNAADFCYWQWFTFGTAVEFYGRVYLYKTANPAAQLIFARQQLSGATCAFLSWETNGKLGVTDADSASTTTTATIPLNEWVRIEYRLKSGATTGIIEAKMFHGHDVSAIETITRTNVNTRASCDTITWGETATVNDAGTTWFDQIYILGTGYPGPAGGSLVYQPFRQASTIYNH